MVDMHMHSNCSDGTKSVKALFETVKESGIKVFSLTDHDNCDGIEEMAKLAANEGIEFIKGIEFSCLMDLEDADSDCHILGYNFDMENKAFIALQDESLRLRKEKLEEMLAYIGERGIKLSEEAEERLRSNKKVGKRSLANEMIKEGFCTENTIWSSEYLGDFKSTLHIGAEEAIRTIQAAGGIAVWAHPFDDKNKREERDSFEKFDGRLKTMIGFGIQGLECAYSKYENDEIEYLLEAADSHGLHITGGSDFHGKEGQEIGRTGIEENHSHVIVPFVEYLRKIGIR